MTVGWERSAYVVNEDIGNVSVCATAQNWTSEDSTLFVNILSRNGTATRKYFVECSLVSHASSIYIFFSENADFGSISKTITLVEPTVCVWITIFNDNLQENNEHFFLEMTLPNSDIGVNVVLSIARAVTNITIIDVGGKTIHFNDSKCMYMRYLACISLFVGAC